MSNDLQPRLGNAARAARKRRGLTRQQVADALGVNVLYYSRIERGHVVPGVPIFVRLALLLKVRADVLLGIDTASPLGTLH